MDQGTPRNIMTQLHMTSDQYNFVTTAYYVGLRPGFARLTGLWVPALMNEPLSGVAHTIGPLHPRRDALEPPSQVRKALGVAGPDHGKSPRSHRCQKYLARILNGLN